MVYPRTNLRRVLGASATLWVIGVPAYCLISWDVGQGLELFWAWVLGERQTVSVRVVRGFAFMGAELLVVPYCMYVGVPLLIGRWRHHWGYWAFVGWIGSMWASTTYLTVPICGVYISLPGLALAMNFIDPSSSGGGFEAAAIAANGLIWIGFSVLLFLIRQQRVVPPGACEVCRYNLEGNVSGRCPECGTTVRRTQDPPFATPVNRE